MNRRFCMGKQYKLFFSNENRNQETVGPRPFDLRSAMRCARFETAVRARSATKDDGGEHPSSPARANGGGSAVVAAVEGETAVRVE